MIRLSKNANNARNSHPDESRDPNNLMIIMEFMDTGFRWYESNIGNLNISDKL